ncbi:hypothetical protein FRACYDRAFT_237458 [Fragilariopsis cylindrus CCMP1102]|uniref:Uncharacterized protein n=1 Tax=Fragilariopsis cylindrus CCMP1102 TaxID=635003 RepID=A0A1E7FLW7_9STRA|nr:hypothetical protein FRACYDRAFT_237458 [Fragilariopsis cylindrus CCMP1102]|eukprot:OEU19168.1 hypothetical protein FRACYDRAFT_237458 [Fragilariopsis cylindrus CCMP1102]
MTTSGVKIIPLLLMPISNIRSWFLILTVNDSTSSTSSDFNSLLSIVWKISYFYTVWALYNKYLGGKPSKEQGHISLGVFTLMCLSISTTGIIPLIISMKGPTQFASKVHKDDRNNVSMLTRIWGYVFTLYIISNIILWSYVFYQFYILFDIDGDGGGGGGGGSSANKVSGYYRDYSRGQQASGGSSSDQEL